MGLDLFAVCISVCGGGVGYLVVVVGVECFVTVSFNPAQSVDPPALAVS